MKKDVKAGMQYVSKCKIPGSILKLGDYSFDVGIYDITNQRSVEDYMGIESLEIINVNYFKNKGRVGAIAPTLQWYNNSVKALE